MPDELETVVSILADAWGLSDQSVQKAMKSNRTVRKRIERISGGYGSDVDLHGLHADVKLVLMGENPGVV